MSKKTKSKYLTALVAKQLCGKYWEIFEDLIFRWWNEKTQQFEDRVAEKGFITDFASIPRIVRPIIGDAAGEYARAAVSHDKEYSLQEKTRRECDLIFLDAMICIGVVPWKRRVMYGAVRAFGWLGWKHHTKTKVKGAK